MSLYDRATCHRDTLPVYLLPDFIRAVDLHVGPPHKLDLRPQTFIANCANKAPRRITKLCGMASVARRLDPEGIAMLINGGLQDLKRRSRSRLGEKRARDPENLVGTTQLLAFALEGLEAVALV